MITITRRLALQLRVVFRRALGLTRGYGPALCFATGRDGIRVRAKSGDAAVQYHAGSELPGELRKEEMWLPFDFLVDVEARRDDAVKLEARPDGHVMAGWRDGDVPQCVRYDLIKSSDVDDFPESDFTISVGGPVSSNTVHYIHTLGARVPDSVLVADGIFWGGDFDLIKELIKEGYEVTVLDLCLYGEDVFESVKDHPGFILSKGDIRDTQLLEKVIPGHDAVIHLACINIHYKISNVCST